MGNSIVQANHHNASETLTRNDHFMQNEQLTSQVTTVKVTLESNHMGLFLSVICTCESTYIVLIYHLKQPCLTA